MSVDRAEVDRIARLARLSLADEEADRLTDEMNRILEHAARLRLASADYGSSAAPAPTEPGRAGEGEVPPIGGVRDEVGSPDPLSEGPEAFAPEWHSGFFVVPPPPGVTAEGE